VETVFLIGEEKGVLRGALKRVLSDRHNVVVFDSTDGLSAHLPLDPGLVLFDLTSSARARIRLMHETRRLLPDCAFVVILPEQYREEDETFMEMVYDAVHLPLKQERLRSVVIRALEKSALLREISMLRNMLQAEKSRKEPAPRSTGSDMGTGLSRVLKEFAKGPGAGFDLKSLADFVHESINHLSQVTKISLVFGSRSAGYRIFSSRGLQREIVNITLCDDQGLLLWLKRQGRVLRRAEASDSPDMLLHQAAREMELLQAVVSIPMMGQGCLLGAINLGEKALGGAYEDEELEMLYVLASNVAIALENITMFQELQHQKSYIEEILLRMNSGVITIDGGETITIFNQRAAEVLERNADDVLGKDLRVLPSPLGDMLSESSTSGRRYDRKEIRIRGVRSCQAEVSTFQLRNGGDEGGGAVLIFDDVSAERDLQREKEKRERLELMNRMLAMMAHELRNPMVSINTFIDLFPEKKTEAEFNDAFYSTVRNDISRLEDLLAKLIGLSRETEYSFEKHDLLEIIADRLKVHGDGFQKKSVTLEERFDLGDYEISADRIELGRAFEYILRNSLDASPEGGTVNVSAAPGDGDQVCVRIEDDGGPLPDIPCDYMWWMFYEGEGRGVDIGLAVAKRIIEDHGGVLRMTDNNGRTRMELILPLYGQGPNGTGTTG
jgi:signal transduction histidine kinase